MDFKDFRAGRDDDSKRLDRIAGRILKDFPGINCQEAIRKRLVRLNGKKASGGDRVFEGDVISVASFLLETAPVRKDDGEKIEKDAEIETVFRNEHILIINKPRGISVQPSESGEKSLSETVAELYPGEGSSLSFRTGPLHRLDRNTSGLLAFSQSSLGARWFSEAISSHQIGKVYLGIAEGRLDGPERWEDFLKDGEKKHGFYTMKSSDGASVGKSAVTKAVPLAYGCTHDTESTLVQYEIETGRKHQIRCQSAMHGHPLAGDSAYGGKGHTFYLHSAAMLFPAENPLGIPEKIYCPPPVDFKNFLDLNLINWDGQLIISYGGAE